MIEPEQPDYRQFILLLVIILTVFMFWIGVM